MDCFCIKSELCIVVLAYSYGNDTKKNSHLLQTLKQMDKYNTLL